MIEVSVQGKTMQECIDKLGDVFMASIPTEHLVEVVRLRMRKQGLEVNVEPSTPPAEQLPNIGPKQGNSIEAIQEEPKRRPGRPPKVVPDPVAKASMIIESPVADALTASGGFPARESGGNGKVEEEAPVSKQQIIDALNAYSATHGGTTSGRQIMKNVCGVTRLVDCTEADFPRLLKALGG
jgi:hypothetical protein